MSVQERLSRIWYDGARGQRLLTPFSWLYGRIEARRARAFASGRRAAIRMPCPVIVVGNLSVGGTGKTPVVAWLAWQLGALGRKVGIASRGYGAAGQGARQVAAGNWEAYGDEPVLLHRRTGVPVVVAADRVAAARHLLGLGADVIVCDDGLQHLRLARDFELVVIDGARGLGNGRLLPAGPLREPAARLSTVTAVVINGEPRAGLCAQLASLGAPSPLFMRMVPAAIEPVRGPNPGGLTLAEQIAALRGAGGAGQDLWGQRLEDLRGVRVHALAGIGNPGRFFDLLASFGLDVTPHAFADHHAFTARDLDLPGKWPILMTEKDAVRCAAFASDRLGFVPVTAQFSPEDAQTLLVEVNASCVRAAVTGTG